MPKRMTVTEKWDDPWYLSLSPQAKLIFEYLRDKCDHIGIWKVNYESLRKDAKFSSKVDVEKHLEELNEVAKELGEDEKIEWFPGRKYVWICNFIKIQYGGVLSVKSSMHRTIFREMGKYWHKNIPKKLALTIGFYENEILYCTPTLQIGYSSTVETYRNGKGNGNGNGKENGKEISRDLKPLGMDVVSVAHQKALKDQKWMEGVRIAHGIMKDGDLEIWLHKFSISIAQDTIENFSDATYRKMFSGWLGKRIANGDKVPVVEVKESNPNYRLKKLA